MQKSITKKKRKMSVKGKIKFAFFFLFLIVLLCCFYYLRVVCPIVTNLSKEKIHSIATSSVSEVVGEVLIENNVTYNDLVQISYTTNNEIELIEVNSVNVNLLIREVTNRVQAKFDKFSSHGIEIALGTFSGIPFLYGLGPQISVQLVPVGTVKTKLDSSFKSAGVNQTLHRLNFVVTASIGMVLPAKTSNVTTDLEVMICESVLVGKIPSVYLENQLI